MDKDSSHIMIFIGVLVLFSVIGISCGLVVHDNCPVHIKDKDSVKTSFVLMIISLAFIICFIGVYLYIHILHTHNAVDHHHSTHGTHHPMAHGTHHPMAHGTHHPMTHGTHHPMTHGTHHPMTHGSTGHGPQMGHRYR
jgi:Na+/proline symporter